MKCAFPGCGNDVRYVDEHGRLTCGTCPVKACIDSIRIADVPKLVGWARDIARAHREDGHVELDPGDIDAVAELIRIDLTPHVPCSRCNGHGWLQHMGGGQVPCEAEGCMNGFVTPRKLEPDTSMVAWPKSEPRRYRGNVVCNMWTGPCACGDTHHEGR